MAYGVIIVSIFVFSYLPFYVGNGDIGSLSLLPLYGWGLLLLMPVAFLVGLLAYYLRYRPIGVDNDGVSTFILRRRWKFITWHEVTQIEKFRVYDSFYYRYQSVFLISARNSRVRFDDWIENPQELVDMVNEKIAEYKIPTFFVDRGRDTLAKITDLSASQEQKKLLRDGVRRQVLQL